LRRAICSGDSLPADTSNPPGNEARAVAIGAERLRAASIPYRVSDFAPGRENLIARLAGDGAKRPLLLLAHVDVVGADGQTWSTTPHRMVEVDGFLVGRGVLDDLGMAAVALEVMSLLPPKRRAAPARRHPRLDGDEESGGSGIRWQLEHDPASLDAEIASQPRAAIRAGRIGARAVSSRCRRRRSSTRTSRSSRGTDGPLVGADGATHPIDRIARALARLAAHRFPARLLPVTRAWLAGRAPLETPERGAAMRAWRRRRGSSPRPRCRDSKRTRSWRRRCARPASPR
jgi:acetylornithine deacetylase/succinyl-diaminopimelate desuccinylase-like protein